MSKTVVVKVKKWDGEYSYVEFDSYNEAFHFYLLNDNAEIVPSLEEGVCW